MRVEGRDNLSCCTLCLRASAKEKTHCAERSRATETVEWHKMGRMDSLSNLEQSLRDTLRKEGSDPAKRARALEIQKQAWDQTRTVLTVPNHLSSVGDQTRDVDLNKTVASIETKEEEVNKRRVEVTLRVNAQVSRVEAEARRLGELRKELDALDEPKKKEIAEMRKKIELVDRELRPLKALSERKVTEKEEKELKDVVSVYNEKSTFKTDLVGKLLEIVSESEKVRMAKLEELNTHLQAMEMKANGR